MPSTDAHPPSSPASPQGAAGPSSGSDALSISGISQRFGDREVLRGVDLTVQAGRVTGLVGPNGAGKTTLMRIIFGVIAPDQGSISWCGRNPTSSDRQGWGYMPQERGLYRDMRVLDQLVWIARLHGLSATEGRSNAVDLLERLGLAERANDEVEALSGGMAQRVQLAAAMVHGPDLLVLDEPFNGLDPVAVEFLSDVILEHVRSGKHLLFSSHQLDLVEDLCEEITMINHGQVVLRGDVRRLKEDSPDRYLHVDVTVDPTWVDAAVAQVTSTDASGSSIRLQPGADAAAVLDSVRSHISVRDFSVRAPSLSELFLEAAGITRAELATQAAEAERSGAPTIGGADS